MVTFDLLITEQQPFRAHVASLSLHGVRLVRIEEWLSRIAFVSPPTDILLVLLPVEQGQPHICAGVPLLSGQLMTVGPGERLHVCSHGRTRWTAIYLSMPHLISHGRILLGKEFQPPSGIQVWQPSRSNLAELLGLVKGAMRLMTLSPQRTVGREAERGLTMQLIPALLDCVSGAPCSEDARTSRRRRLMVQVEEVIRAVGDTVSGPTDLSALMDVSTRSLRACFREQVLLAPSHYLRLKRSADVGRAVPGSGR